MKFVCEDCGKKFNEVVDEDMIFDSDEGWHALTNCPNCGAFVTTFDVNVKEA